MNFPPSVPSEIQAQNTHGSSNDKIWYRFHPQKSWALSPLQAPVEMLIIVPSTKMHLSVRISSCSDGLMGQYFPETKEDSDVKSDIKIEEPPLYKVLLHNDDYTTMEFVVHILMLVFHKSAEEATRIMLNVHQVGIGLCGIFTYEIAETKVETVIRMARENGHPLKCTMEKA